MALVPAFGTALSRRLELDEEQTITVREPDAATHLPPQYDQLMSECSVLCLKSALRLERRDEKGQEERTERSSPLTLGDSIT
jgi:hypothetical protein